MIDDMKEKKIAREVLIDKLIQMGPTAVAFLAFSVSSHVPRFAETSISYIYSTTDDGRASRTKYF